MALFKKKDKEVTEAEKVSKNKITIKVYMRFGSDVRHLRASYDAEEKRDAYNNLVAINEEFLHNEDVDFSQEDVYSSMDIALGIEGKSKKEQIDAIDKHITLYKKRVEAIDKFPELNVFANYWDQKRRLRELEIYKIYINTHTEKGSYYEMEKGLRTYKFESLDGFLIPIWQGADNLTDYPDFTRKKKITMQKTADLTAYFDTKGGKRLIASAFVIVMLITALFGLGNVWGGIKLYNEHQENAARWEEPANYCADQMAKSYSVFVKLLENAVVYETVQNNTQLKNEINNQIRELNPNS